MHSQNRRHHEYKDLEKLSLSFVVGSTRKQLGSMITARIPYMSLVLMATWSRIDYLILP